ncbi:molybdate ABC transporter permease subunit, partial [Xanthomonas oryzae pv. oryzae]
MSMFTPEELTAIGLSLKVAIVAALASLPPGIA